MTVKRDLKSIIRERQQKTGESYTAARYVMRERAKLLGVGDDSQREIGKPTLVEAAVLAVAQTTAIVRILGEGAPISLRATGVKKLVPGHPRDAAPREALVDARRELRVRSDRRRAHRRCSPRTRTAAA